VLAVAILLLLSYAADSGRAGADALLQAGRYQESALAYIALLRNAPDDPDLLEGAGRSLIGLAAPERAIPFFEREIALRPLSHDGSRWLSEAFIAAGKFEAARQLLARMVVADPADGGTWSQLGLVSYRTGYYPAALNAFDHALTAGKGLETASTRNRVEVLRAISLVETGATADAASVVPGLLARPENTANLDLLLIYVRLLYETGSHAEALRQSDRALAVAPGNAAVHFWRARLFQENDEIARAVSEAERSRDLAPSSPAPRSLLVRLYRKSGRDEDAGREAGWLREHESADGRAQP
jgi:tetratricopeptide (TPR) repeat protein